MQKLGWSAAMAALVTLAVAAPAQQVEAQQVQVQGQVQVQAQPYGQPQGQPTPPPGYGQPQPQAQPYQQPYAPTYQQPQQQIRYEERTTTIKGLWIPGMILFGVSYVLTATFGQIGWDADYNAWTIVPILGPWVALGYTTSPSEVTGAVLGGVLQTAGLTMFILGLALQRTVRVAVRALDEHDERSPQIALDALPAPGGAQLGLTFSHF